MPRFLPKFSLPTLIFAQISNPQLSGHTGNLHRFAGATADIGGDEYSECFPTDHNDYSDWDLIGRPECWCATPYTYGYQCYGTLPTMSTLWGIVSIRPT